MMMLFHRPSPGLGCGHYIPRFTSLLLDREDVSIGPCLANYCFNFDTDFWKDGIDEAVSVTKKAFPPDHPLFIYIDKKSFKSAARQQLVEHLEARGLRYGYKAEDIK